MSFDKSAREAGLLVVVVVVVDIVRVSGQGPAAPHPVPARPAHNTGSPACLMATSLTC